MDNLTPQQIDELEALVLKELSRRLRILAVGAAAGAAYLALNFMAARYLVDYFGLSLEALLK